MKNKVLLSGGLRFIGLADLFQMLGGNRSTGTLRIKGPEHLPLGLIHFADGNPVNAVNGTLCGIEAVYPMFGWTDGTFEFCEETSQVERVITTGRMKIVLDALRLLDEGIIKREGPFADTASPGSLGRNANHLSEDGTLIIKGPPVDFAYFVQEQKYSAGEEIVREGQLNRGLMVILEGTVRITRETPMGPVTVAHLGEGSFIGSFSAFTYQGYTRTATATAVSNVYIAVLDASALYAEYSSLSLNFRKLLLSLSSRLKKISDRLVFPSIPYAQCDCAGKSVDRELLYEDIYLITQGEAYLCHKTSHSNKKLFMLGKDDMLGHLPIFEFGQEPQALSVLCSEPFQFEKLDKEQILEEYEKTPMVFQDVISNFCTCIAQTTKDYLALE
jgi:CRP-like cAMP-binding protein